MSLLILGVGNDLLGDDGIGLEAIDSLKDLESREVSVESSVQSGLYLLERLTDHDDVIIVDSVLGDQPGRVRELTFQEIRPKAVPSAHYAGLPEALALARNSGLKVPERIRIIGVEMNGVQFIGSRPSPRVRAAIPEIELKVDGIMDEWGYARP